MSSSVTLVKRGSKETETVLLEAEGLAVMRNADGSLVFELYPTSARGNAYRFRVSADDAWNARDTLRKWASTTKPPSRN